MNTAATFSKEAIDAFDKENDVSRQADKPIYVATQIYDS
jgi:hypothetical protein